MKTIKRVCLAALLVGLFSFSIFAHAEDKPRLFVGYSVRGMADVDPKDAEAALRVWSQEIGYRFGFDLVTQLYDSSDRLARDFQDRKLDFVTLPVLDYLRLAPVLNARPELGMVRDNSPTTKYLLLVPRPAAKDGLAGLKNQRLAVMHHNQLGRLFLNTELLKAGLPESDRLFGSVQEKSKESQAVLAVFFGQADACLVSDKAFKTMEELNPQVGKKLQILLESPGFVDVVGFFHPDYPKVHKETAIGGMRGDIKEFERGRQIMILFNVDRVDRIREEDFNAVKKMVSDYDRLKRKK